MGLLECASGASVLRGYDYFKEKKVVNLEEIGEEAMKMVMDDDVVSGCHCSYADGLTRA